MHGLSFVHMEAISVNIRIRIERSFKDLLRILNSPIPKHRFKGH